MRMIAVLLPLLLVGAAPPVGAPEMAVPPGRSPVGTLPPDCRPLNAADTDGQAMFQRLGDLPPATAYQAVWRSGPDGCLDPLLVSERIRQFEPRVRR